ncbi:hypothetical protein BDV33DRAFT_204866 [Aspergillus novoparasiticus]|uniref:Uncharacterized protein n=1 Tax=Aspergillus novoparasiticus TaxID=986946 RepID=A0A5N6EQF7_9EURO|nr:hypothetical protein BDV33DRAFT_204866 [Aspergillus novoparasiticus]
MNAYDLALEDAEQNEALIRVRNDVILTTILVTKTREEFGQGSPDTQCQASLADQKGQSHGMWKERLQFMAWRGIGSTHHGSTNSTRTIRRDCEVHIGDLHNVLHVDPTTRKAFVEPNVPKDRLLEATTEYGLVPPVLMEFPGITAGISFAARPGKFPGVRKGQEG